MHIDDMAAEQRGTIAGAALDTAIGVALAALHPLHWLIGVLGFVLIAIVAARLRPIRKGFEEAQLCASLCAGCKVACMALDGTMVRLLFLMALPVLETLLVYALWQGFGRMCAEGNRIGRAALCAELLCAALAIAGTVLGLMGRLLPALSLTAHRMSLGFEALAAVLLAVFLLRKRQKIKEDIQ